MPLQTKPSPAFPLSPPNNLGDPLTAAPHLQVRSVLSAAILLLVQQAFDVGEKLLIEESSGWRFDGEVMVGVQYDGLHGWAGLGPACALDCVPEHE